MQLDQFQNREDLYRFLLDAAKTNDCITVAKLAFGIFLDWSQDEEIRLGLNDVDYDLIYSLMMMDAGEEFEYNKEELIAMIEQYKQHGMDRSAK